MKSTTGLLIAGLCASLAAATPLDKRALVTTYEIVTVTATVTGYPPAKSTDAPADAGSGGWSNWGGWRGGNGAGSWGGDATTFTQPAPSMEAPAPQNPAPSFNQAPAPAEESSSSSSAWSSSAPPSNPKPTSVSSDYQQGILDAHNIHRANHSVSDLSWDDKLAGIAAQIAASCVYAHDTSTGGGGYGQNIGAGSPPSDIPSMIGDLMYNDEINFYPGYGGEPDMSNFHAWGHFSQIVWKSTTGVGCATQYCPNGLANTGGGVSPYFTVCNYGPPGNFGGQYGANVLAPLGHPTVSI
ncbi:hypothetical protein LTR84_012132 [Exophiala bonariae]|uniref:SCP domain-containing protein n=1 Tax=Exophiala bonariae TaxID=1690606 RepID=A0AAV9NHX0_9EURO|nr:hypothetical protein LTR84_012132 [Exophiala bonariae]